MHKLHECPCAESNASSSSLHKSVSVMLASRINWWDILNPGTGREPEQDAIYQSW